MQFCYIAITFFPNTNTKTMKRRDFITTGTLAAASVSSLLASCKPDSAKSTTTSATAEKDVVNDFELNEESILSLQEKMAAGKYSSEQITNLYLQRIDAIDKKGALLNAIIELNPDAVSIARSLDQERKSGKIRGPLHGIPVLIKDNINTGDKMQTTAGALAMQGHIAAMDAFVIKRLREAGVVILGKTNLSEWANFRSSHSSSGWSSRGGQTKNPYILDHNPCGSSSGSGAAVAANLCVVAVGTETDGSITCPASVNGVVGIKPTVGLVSRSGIIPIAASQDTAGPMARTVADAAALLTVLAGYDPDDPATAPLQDHPPPDYSRFLDATSLKGARIGVMRHYAGFYDDVDRLFERALAVLRSRGAVLVDPADIPTADKLDADEQIVLAYEFKDGINRYLATREGSGPRTLAELIAFNQRAAAREMPFFGQELF